MNKILKIILILNLIFNFSITSNAETIEDLVNELNDIKDDLNSLSQSNKDDIKTIDNSLKEINKVTDFAIQNIESGNLDTAADALAYSDKLIGDVGKQIPKEFKSDMSNANLDDFSEDKMKELKNITDDMNAKKEDDKNKLLDQIIELNNQGFNTTDIGDSLATMGIETITLIELDNRKFDKIKNQIVDTQVQITEKENNLNQLEQKIDPLESQLRSLNDQKKSLNEKYKNDLSLNPENKELTTSYETELSSLNERIGKIETEKASISASINNINSDLNSLIANQEAAAKTANDLIPNTDLSIKFNYENSSIDLNAAKVGLVSMAKSKEEWANTWKGEVLTTKIVNGAEVNLTDEEILNAKADLAMQETIKAISTGEISSEIELSSSELNLATTLSTSVMVETLKRQSDYLSYAVKEGMHEMTPDSAMEGLKSLGKTEKEWAEAWTGEAPSTRMVNGVSIKLSADEIQATKAEWAMNSAAQSIMDGNIVNNSIKIDQAEIQQAVTSATEIALNDVQEKAANIASQVASTAEAVQILQQGLTEEIGSELAQSVTDIVSNNASLAANVAERAIDTVEELEEYLAIDTSALVSDTSSWTNADWAASWTGDPATHKMVNGERVELTAAEQEAIHADWAKNRAEQMGN